MECERAVYLFVRSLKEECPSCNLIDAHISRYAKNDCYSSALLSMNDDVEAIEGTVQWICQSPFRPHHKRKNWYIDVSIIPELPEAQAFDKKDVVFERLHSGGKGGQNVNKVETGVRLSHKPTGISVVCTEERSQHQNRRKAEERLCAMLALKDHEAKCQHNRQAWGKHHQLQRGNPARVYGGPKFKRIR